MENTPTISSKSRFYEALTLLTKAFAALLNLIVNIIAYLIVGIICLIVLVLIFKVVGFFIAGILALFGYHRRDNCD